MNRLVFLLPLIGLFAVPQGSLAWGPEGHRIIALIAQYYLNNDQDVVSKLLDIKNGSFDQNDLMTNDTYDGKDRVDDDLKLFFSQPDLELGLIAGWADAWDTQKDNPAARATARWHFVDLPVDATPTDDAVSQACPDRRCVIDQLQDQAAILADPSAAPEDRVKALFFVVHFAGDIHQPLHCATEYDSNGQSDRGGNLKQVIFYGTDTVGPPDHPRPRNLHALWDSYFIEQYEKQQVYHSEAEYAGDLIQDIESNHKGQAWQNTDVESWAFESHAVAVSIYADYHSKLASGQSTADYEQEDEDKWMPVVNTQLEKAGVRLAYLLEQTLNGKIN